MFLSIIAFEEFILTVLKRLSYLPDLLWHIITGGSSIFNELLSLISPKMNVYIKNRCKVLNYLYETEKLNKYLPTNPRLHIS